MLYIPECPAHKVGINIPPGESSDVPLINAKTVCAYAVDDLCGGSIYDGSVQAPGTAFACVSFRESHSAGRPAGDLLQTGKSNFRKNDCGKISHSGICIRTSRTRPGVRQTFALLLFA